MRISYEWLLEYLPEPIAIDELSTILTGIGLEVEGVETIEAVKGGLNGVVVGHVLECEKHPGADKLKLTKVDIGQGEPLQIVCGAPNVAQGQKVLVATVGTILYPTQGGTFEIKPAKIRGEHSYGMICAEDELGLGTSHEGIMILPEDTPVGIPAAEFFKLPKPQTVFEIGLTPNRSDAMSHLGVARDICAYLSHHKGSDYKPRLPINQFPSASEELHISVNIEDNARCLRYAGVVIKNVQVVESPEWLKQKLQAIGQQPINNVVDATNFVLHEMGYPLHAFDYDTIADKSIIVKTLPEGTPFIALDGKEYKLSAEDLCICDTQGTMCIAGVYGGAHSGVKASTKNIFLEAAYFDPKSIRRTSLRHGLRTEAASHFEKKVDIDQCIEALKRAVALIVEIGQGEIASKVIDVYPSELQRTEVSFRYDYIDLLCGKTYEHAQVNRLLEHLGFEILAQDEVQCKVLVPHYKADVQQAADIAEEILRIDGLNNIPTSEQISFSIPKSISNPVWEYRERICNWLSDKGLNEILTNSIVNSAHYPEENQVKMLNSLSSELNALRPELMPSGLEVIAYNVNRGEKNLALYEWANVYHRYENYDFRQERRLGIWVTGQREIQQWQVPSVPYDLYYLKGILQALATKLGISGLNWQAENSKLYFVQEKKKLAELYIPDSDVLKRFGIKQTVYYAELYVDEWMQIASLSKTKFKELNKFPSVDRDLSIVVDSAVTYAQIEQATRKVKSTALRSYRLFDIFEGEKLGAGKRAWALNYVFQAADKTLTDAEVDEVMNQLIKTYEKELGATLRQ